MSFRQLIRYLRKRSEAEENPRSCAKCKHFRYTATMLEGKMGSCLAANNHVYVPGGGEVVTSSGHIRLPSGAVVAPLTVVSTQTCADRTLYRSIDDFEPLEECPGSV